MEAQVLRGRLDRSLELHCGAISRVQQQHQDECFDIFFCLGGSPRCKTCNGLGEVQISMQSQTLET